jgi:hypothetical protein
VEKAAASLSAKAYKVFADGLPDARMQNVAIIAEILRSKLVPGLRREHVLSAMGDVMEGAALESNASLLAM